MGRFKAFKGTFGVSSASCARSRWLVQGLITHSRLCFTISHRRFLLVTLVDTPTPHVWEQAPHSVVCSMQFRLESQPSNLTVSSWR